MNPQHSQHADPTRPQEHPEIVVGSDMPKPQPKPWAKRLPWVTGTAAFVLSAAIVVTLLLGYNRHDSAVPTITVADDQVAEQTTAQDDGEATAAPTHPEMPIATTQPTTPAKPTEPSFTTSIGIDGDANCQKDTLAALELISEKAPTHYAIVTQYVGTIKCVAQGSGMEAYLSPPRFLAGDTTRNAGTMWYAGTIVHDAGHSKLYHDYLTAQPGQSVPSDIWTGHNAEATCLDAQYDALQKMGADQTTLDYVQNIINSEYWNVPYNDRWW